MNAGYESALTTSASGIFCENEGRTAKFTAVTRASVRADDIEKRKGVGDRFTVKVFEFAYTARAAWSCGAPDRVL